MLMHALAIAALVVLDACGARVSAPRSTQGTTARSPHVEDLFDAPPQALLVLRPLQIKRDPLYGPLWQRAMREALARGGAGVVGDRALEAASGADAIVIGEFQRESGAVIVALRGVPSSLEPTRLRDAEGQPLWTYVATNGAITEYAPESPNQGGVLFVLPGREWVFLIGNEASRVRARLRFANPRGVPPIEGDDSSLALLRIRGDGLAHDLHQFRNGPLAPIGARLASLTMSLAPGTERAFAVTFSYLDDTAAFAAEKIIRDVTKALAEAKTEDNLSRFGWLRAASISREGLTVTMHAALPPQLLRDLPNAGFAHLQPFALSATVAEH
jgi:hypothetical protein